MSIPPRPDARLLFRVDPLQGESPRGYLCRVAQAHGYCGPLFLAQLAGVSRSGLDQDEHVQRIAHVLRLEPQEWRAMSYTYLPGRDRLHQRSFSGDHISTDHLNYRRPRLCPACLGERPIWWAVWDLGLVTACPIHRCLLLHQCPACTRDLAWHRPAVEKCRCGLDLRTLPSEAAAPDLLAMNAAIYHAAGFPTDTTATLEEGRCRFAPDMRALGVGALLRLVVFAGSLKEKDRLCRKALPFVATDLHATIAIGRAAATVLSDWPHPFHAHLRHMVSQAPGAAAGQFDAVFGRLYRHVFHVFPGREFGFLHHAFERFVVEEWQWPMRRAHRHLAVASGQWISSRQAEQRAHTDGGRLVQLVRQGRIEGLFWRIASGRGRTECWMSRASLDRWIASRDRALARYMPRPEAQRALGLKGDTLMSVAAAGLVRSINASEHGFPSTGRYFLRADVMHIRDAFEQHAVPEREYVHPGRCIALRDALKHYLSRVAGLPAVIRAVLNSSLAPVAYTNRFRGITGYIFAWEDLRRYRALHDASVAPAVLLSYREAAAVIGVAPPVIRGMVAHGILAAPVAGYRNGFAKLLPAAAVQAFADQYVAAPVLAKRLHLRTGAFMRLLGQSGTSVLSVPIPEPRKKDALFLLKHVAAHMPLPATDAHERGRSEGTIGLQSAFQTCIGMQVGDW